MDELDGLALGLCVAGLAVTVLLLAWVVRDMRTDIEIIRLTAGAPISEGN